MTRKSLWLWLAVITAVASFLVDTQVQLGIAVGLAYVAVVWFAGGTREPRWVWLSAMLCAALIVAGMMLSPDGGEWWIVLLNRCLCLVALLLTASMIVHILKLLHRHAELNDELAHVASRLALPERAADSETKSFCLSEFSLSDMIDCGSVIRGMVADLHNGCIEPAANRDGVFAERLCRYLYDHLLDDRGGRACALVRVFETRRWDELNASQQGFAQSMAPDLRPDTRCLTLLATAGERKAWNDARQSTGHKAIPLIGEKAVERLPMIAQLIRQLGFQVSGVLQADPEILLQSHRTGVFHVAEAKDSPMIPAQEEFVKPCAIRSVVGFGDALPNGRVFAVILFAKIPIRRETAGLLSHLSHSARLALLSLTDVADKTEAQILSVERLLANHEMIVTEQEHRLKNAVSDLRRTADALARSNDDLEQFAYAASHDLQEPLRAVAGYCDLLEKLYGQRFDGEAKEFLDFAVDGAKRMQTLINNLLDYSRIGTRGQQLQPVPARAVFDEAVTNLLPRIDETNAKITTDQLPTVRADRLQLMRLFQNLLSNALKFRGNETPQIHVSANRNGRDWIFSVRDNGIGIDKQYFDRIFVIFQRLHTRRKYSGTGVGLALCKRIVDRHGGRLWVDSQIGKGSEFFFTLPIEESNS